MAAAAAGGHSGGSFRDNQGFISLVCKHWLRGLCKKGEGCEFLHEYNLRKMPECNFFLRNGYCSNGDECLYLHIDPRSKLPPCPDYDNRGFCALGPTCPKKHVRRKAICPYYLAGFCPEGARGGRTGGGSSGRAAEAGIDLASLDNGNNTGSPMGGGMGDDYAMGGADGDGHGHHQSSFQHGGHQRHGGGGGDDDRSSRGDYRGGFNKDRGRGGRWRGRGGGRGQGFRGRGRGDH
ncbi:mrna 3 -end-processing protein yth-1 [Ophiostoma piceae UAMH 11346]|uniref:mRNA 3'-end-processing protein n=1 Tax=Ophiostoma piceae (strain UAMH 11346) TaxID=1262450 RepID=S3CIK9_OPHP1|nr:mrna 3 -end-processing protein yth-1 [Ophiostoma piceae UAMH 11346]